MVIRAQYISAEEFWELAHLPENADKHLELIEGVVYEMPPDGEEYDTEGGNFFGFIWNYVRANDLGRVTMAETGYVVYTDASGKDTVLAPDVGFIAKARTSAVPSKKYFPGAPDLAVEVVSPNDKAGEIRAKVNKYLQFGTRMVCVAYPSTKTVEVYTPSGAHTLTESDVFDGADVLPGFKLPISDIFA